MLISPRIHFNIHARQVTNSFCISSADRLSHLMRIPSLNLLFSGCLPLLFQLLNFFTHLHIQFTLPLISCVFLSCVIVYVYLKLGYVLFLIVSLQGLFQGLFNVFISYLKSLLIGNKAGHKVYNITLHGFEMQHFFDLSLLTHMCRMK